MLHPRATCSNNPRGGGIGACGVDAGGPLTNRETPRVLVGILSWTLRCASGHPDVYTRVFPYVQFIRGVMQA